MKRNGFISVPVFWVLVAGTCMAQTDIAKMMGNLDVYGIKKLQVMSNPNDYSMSLVATVTNANSEALRLRSGECEVIFDKKKGGALLLGRTRIIDQILPGKAGDQAGQADMSLLISVGPQSPSTVDKLFEVVNIIGDPDANLRITIRGKAEVGMQLPRGWVYEQGKKLEVELVFTPAIQREFILK